MTLADARHHLLGLRNHLQRQVVANGDALCAALALAGVDDDVEHPAFALLLGGTFVILPRLGPLGLEHLPVGPGEPPFEPPHRGLDLGLGLGHAPPRGLRESVVRNRWPPPGASDDRPVGRPPGPGGTRPRPPRRPGRPPSGRVRHGGSTS